MLVDKEWYFEIGDEASQSSKGLGIVFLFIVIAYSILLFSK